MAPSRSRLRASHGNGCGYRAADQSHCEDQIRAIQSTSSTEPLVVRFAADGDTK
jgi:hypothetical protein